MIFNDEKSATVSNNLIGAQYDPLFVNAATHDFHLIAGSPAIGKGLVLKEVKTDFDDIKRDLGRSFDIGAYAFSSAPLGKPTNLVINSYK